MAAEVDAWSDAEAGNGRGAAGAKPAGAAEQTGEGSLLDASLAAEEEHTHLLHPPSSCAGRLLYAVSLPMLVCFWLTVPDVRRPKLAKWYPVTMCMAVVWLAFLAEVSTGN